MFATGGSEGRFPNQYPGRVGSPDGGGPLEEDTLVEEGHLGPQEDKDHQALEDQ